MPSSEWLAKIAKTITILRGDYQEFDGQGLFYWDAEMAAEHRNNQLQEELVPILRVITKDASVFLTVRYRRTGRTVASMRLYHEQGWLRYSVANAYVVRVTNEHDENIEIQFNPFKGIELTSTKNIQQKSYV